MERRQKMAGVAAAIIGLLMVTCAFAAVTTTSSAALPSTVEWQVEDDMGGPRAQAVVVGDGDGTAYIMGGVDNITGGYYHSPVNDTASYDLEDGTWTELAPMPTPTRGSAGAMGADGNVYVFGGFNTSTLNLTQIYDPATDSWTTGASMPHAVWEAKAATGPNGNIYVIGGEPHFNKVQIYDPSTDSWSAGSPAPETMVSGALIADGSYLYYVGGSDSSYTPKDSVLRYSISSDYWYTGYVSDLPVPISSLTGTIGPDGLMYVMGGGSSHFNIGPGNASGYYYDWSTDSWNEIPALNTGARYAGSAMTDDGRIFVLGGNNATHIYDRVESLLLYDVEIELSPNPVGQGDSLMATISVDHAMLEIEDFYGAVYIVGPDDVTYSTTYIESPTPGPYGQEVAIPQSAPVGEYTLSVPYLSVDYGDASTSLTVADQTFSVFDTVTVDERITEMESNMSDMEQSLNSQIQDLSDQADALQSDNADLQDKLDNTTTLLYVVLGLLAVTLIVAIVAVVRK